MSEQPWYLRDLKHPAWIVAKGVLFVVLGVLAVVATFQWPGKGWGFAICYALSVWAFCRAYYFAFYVITHYVDTGFKYAGLWDFIAYCFRRNRR